MRALELTSDWPVPTVAAAIARRGEVLDSVGPTDRAFRLASISKTLVAWACLVGVEEGIIALDDPVGPDDGHHRTLRHLLAHAAGYGFNEGDPIGPPERRRRYGNFDIEVAADHLAAAAEMPFDDYLRLGVLDPLGMNSTENRGSPAYQIWSTVGDLVAFTGEVSAPVLVTAETAALSVRPQFPSLGGIVPGVGRYDNCPWGLGFEIRGDKKPHWTGSRNSAATYGHFGGAGTMMWSDPAHEDLTVVALTDRVFDEWATEALAAWPALSDAAIEEFAVGSGAVGA